MSTGFLGAGDSRQLLIRAERQREKQLASLFYKTAGSSSRPNVMNTTKRRKRKKPNASKAGGQPFAGVRRRPRQPRTNTHQNNNTKSLSVSRSNMSKSLPVLSDVNHNNPSNSNSNSTSTSNHNHNNHTSNNNTIDAGGSALDGFAQAAMASTIDDSSSINLHATTISPERAWDANQANDSQLYRFTALANSELSTRVPQPIEIREPVSEGYKTYKNVEHHQQQQQLHYQLQLQQQEEDRINTMGGEVSTLGGTNLPLVHSQHGSNTLPILSLEAISSTAMGSIQQQGDVVFDNEEDSYHRNRTTNQQNHQNHQQRQRPSNAIQLDSRILKKRIGAPPIIHSNSTMELSQNGLIEHDMHYNSTGVGRRVSPERYGTIGDRVAGILLLRTEQLENEIRLNKGNEQKLLSNIQKGINYSRRNLLPLDFVFRKALARFRKSFLEVAVKKWLSFIVRSRTIEKLLLKVEPYCIRIQKSWRGVMGRKRAKIVKELIRIEKKQRRLGACQLIQAWWKRQCIKINIKNRFIHNVARRRLLATLKIQRIWYGFLGREIARHRFRGVRLAPSMTEIIKYRHAMEDHEQLVVMKLSAILFDQRGDSFGDGKHKKPYTLIELKKAEQTALSLRDKRRLSIKKKKEKWSSEAAERRLEVRQNLKQNEQNKFELRIIEERQKLIELERKKQIEIERMKLKKIKELKEIEEKKQHQLKLEQDELNRIHRIKNEMKENSKKELDERMHREENEKKTYQRLQNEKQMEQQAHEMRIFEQKKAEAIRNGTWIEPVVIEEKVDGVHVEGVAGEGEEQNTALSLHQEEEEMKQHQLEENEVMKGTETKEMETKEVEKIDGEDVNEDGAVIVSSVNKTEEEESNKMEDTTPTTEKEEVVSVKDEMPSESVNPTNDSNSNDKVVLETSPSTEPISSATDFKNEPQSLFNDNKKQEQTTTDTKEDTTSISGGLLNSTPPIEEDTPINSTEPQPEEQPTETKDTEPTEPTKRRGGGELFSIQAIEDYVADPDRQDEISLVKGNQIEVMDREDPDWWMVKNKSNNNQTGMVPASAIARRGVEVRPREDYTPGLKNENPEEEEEEIEDSEDSDADEKLHFEYGDFIEVLDWDDADWWRGRNMSNGKTGEFPSDLVYLPHEWIEEEERIANEFNSMENELKAEEMKKLEKFSRGLAADGVSTSDSRNALFTIFNLMDYNSNGTIERYDMLRSVTLDGSRLEAIVELGLGKLRFWLSPRNWQRLYMLMVYEQNVLSRLKMKKEGLLQHEEEKEEVVKGGIEKEKEVVVNKSMAETIVLLDDAMIRKNETNINMMDITKKKTAKDTQSTQATDEDLIIQDILTTTITTAIDTTATNQDIISDILTSTIETAIQQQKIIKMKKVIKILPHHEQGGGVSFEAFVKCVTDPAASLARWEQYQVQRRLELTHHEVIAVTHTIMNAAVNLVDPPEARAQRVIDYEKRKAQARDDMIVAGVALIQKAIQRERSQGSVSTNNGDNSDNDSGGGIGISIAGGFGVLKDKDVHDKAAMVLQMEQRLKIYISRPKLLHFLAVSRLQKLKLVQEYPVLKRLLAMEDEVGGTAPQAEILRPLLVAANEEGLGDVVTVRRLMPLLGWDSRVDIVTMERLPGFEICEEEEEEKKKEEEKKEGIVIEKRMEVNVPVDMMNEQGTMPTGNAVDVIRQLKKEKDEVEEVKQKSIE